MTKSERFRILLERGYFPEELPPPFHTHDLARYRAHIAQSWNANQSYPSSTAGAYSNPRLRQLRRTLAIVNPVAQFYLARLVADNWMTIRTHLRKSLYSLVTPDIEGDKDRAVPPPDFALLTVRRIEISASFDHALVADISRFYGTLYTHAIPWALHGKDWCKRKLHSTTYKNTLGNKLDIAVRKGQENQTIGIPVGPDTSRILSEIVGVAIDKHVQHELKIARARAFRYVDDWYIGFENAGEAEDAIATIAMGCRRFELELNSEKTRTLHASSEIDAMWSTELKEHSFRSGTNGGQARFIEHYFIKAFNFSLLHPDQNVLDYAIKRTRGVRVVQRNWHIYETFLLKAARANPTVIPTVVQILVSYNFNGYTVGHERIAALIEDVIRKNAPLGHHAEVAWALFLAKGLRLPVSTKSARAVSNLDNPITALIALELRQSGLIGAGLDTGLWDTSMTPQGLCSHMWLLAYEADLKGWLTGTPTAFVQQDPYFKVLKQRGVSFYDVKKNVAHIRKQKPKGPSTALLEFLKEADATPPSDVLGFTVSGPVSGFPSGEY